MRHSTQNIPQRVERQDSVEVRLVGHRFNGAMLYRVDPSDAVHADLVGKKVGANVSFRFDGLEHLAPGTIVKIRREKRRAVPPISEARQQLLD